MRHETNIRLLEQAEERERSAEFWRYAARVFRALGDNREADRAVRRANEDERRAGQRRAMIGA